MHTRSRNLHSKSSLIVLENSIFPLDPRVYKESISLRDAGWTVNVLCPFMEKYVRDDVTLGNFWDSRLKDGVYVNYYPLSFAETGALSFFLEYLTAFYWIALRSWSIWRQTRFNVIHFCNPPDIFFPIAVFYRLLGVRVVFDHHDLFPELIAVRYQGIKGRLFYWFARALEFMTFHAAHVVISTNRSFQEIAVKRGKYPSDRIFVVRNGPKLSDFVPVEPDPSLKDGYARMVAYAGVMGYQDGVLELLQSIRYLVHDQKRRDILFVLLGDGAARPAFSRFIEEWGIDCVRMPGMILDNHLLRKYLSTADVLVSPEPFNELNNNSTFIKVGEYLAMGKPVVAYDLKETRYTAQDAALYASCGDSNAFGNAIMQLLDQPELSASLSDLAKKRAVELSWEGQQMRLLSAYNTALYSR